MFKKKDNHFLVSQVIKSRDNYRELMDTNIQPYIHNICKAAEMIRSHKGPVWVVGDYDCDGVAATAIMYIGLCRFGIKPKVRLPKRFSEGYGLSEKIIDEIDQGLVITVDNGIAAAGSIKKAKEKGLKVIVTDHHLAPVDVMGNMILPEADVIVDPWTEDRSEFKKYCGAAIAYRLIETLLSGKNTDDLKTLAAIATVADVMDLVGANRVLVKEGLDLLNKGCTVPGLSSLMQKIQLTGPVTEDDLGFKFGPVINASGRLLDAGANNPLRVLLSTPSDTRLSWMTDKLIEYNDERKKLVSSSLQSIPDIHYDNRAVVVYDPSWGEGIIGLIAGQLCEKYYCPVIAFTKTERGILKGSGRSIDGIHIKEKLDNMKYLMLGYGGHAGACGLSINPDNLDAFIKTFRDVCGPVPNRPERTYDLELPWDMTETLKDLRKYAPFGNGNPKPVFHFRYHINNVRSVGDDGRHFAAFGGGLSLIGFDLWEKYERLGMPEDLEVIGYLVEHWYNGVMSPKVEVIDFEPIVSL